LEDDVSVTESELDVSFESSLSEPETGSCFLVLCFRESLPGVGSVGSGVSAGSGGGAAAGWSSFSLSRVSRGVVGDKSCCEDSAWNSLVFLRIGRRG